MHRVGTRSVAIAGGFTEQSANPTRLHGNETELVQKQTSLFPFLALGSSQLGRKPALYSSQPAGCNSCLPSRLKTVSPETSKANAGAGSFLSFFNCVSLGLFMHFPAEMSCL